VRGVSIGLLGMTSAFPRRKWTRTEQEGHSPGSPTQPGTRLRGQPGTTVSAFLSSMSSANGLLQSGNRAIERQLPDQASNEATNLRFKASELISSSSAFCTLLSATGWRIGLMPQLTAFEGLRLVGGEGAGSPPV
jgi:hypothetical protein